MTKVYYRIDHVTAGLRRILTGLSEYYSSKHFVYSHNDRPRIFDITNSNGHELTIDFGTLAKAEQQKILKSLETILTRLEVDFEVNKRKK